MFFLRKYFFIIITTISGVQYTLLAPLHIFPWAILFPPFPSFSQGTSTHLFVNLFIHSFTYAIQKPFAGNDETNWQTS